MIPNVSRATVLAVVLLFCLTSRTHAQAPDDSKSSSLMRGVDTSINPGDDFFAYANGEWLKKTEIPAGKERWGVRDEINIIAHDRVLKLMDDASNAKAGTLDRKVADFRAAYVNESAIESRGLASIKPLLDSIDRISDKAALTRMLGHMLPADVDPLNYGDYQSSHVLGLSVEPSIHGEKNYVAFLVQGGLGLDRDIYLSADPKMQALKDKYHLYIVGMLSLSGRDNAHERSFGVVALETALARVQATEAQSARDRNADTVWTRADFARNAPGMDWAAFFTAARLVNQQTFVPWQPNAVRGLAALVASQPLDAWKDYLRFHALDRYADVLPRAFADSASAYHNTRDVARPQRGLDATQLMMTDAIGKMYSDKYFPAEQKARVQGIVANVKAAFIKRVEANTWMEPATKKIALAKLKKLYVGIGYPDKWPDFASLSVDPGDASGNQRRVEEWNYRRLLSLVGQPVDIRDWMVPPQRAGALLSFQQNAYDFSAALLQSTKFDPSASDAANYGSIGAIIGHDITHYVDVLGADYVVSGAMRRWWTPLDSARFEVAAQPLVEQFSSYQPFPNVHVNGRVSRTENVADLGGLQAAFDAYRLTLGARISDKEYVKSQDREFFLGFAQSYRAKVSDASLRKQSELDHAPETYRIDTVRNFDAWYDAFEVRRGWASFTATAARVRIW